MAYNPKMLISWYGGLKISTSIFGLHKPYIFFVFACIYYQSNMVWGPKTITFGFFIFNSNFSFEINI